MKEVIAHLHPLLVHLPIGILLLAAVFAWMSRRERFVPLLAALPIIMRLGAVSAIAACFSGWLLGSSGGYDPDTLGLHKWMGIATAILATLACFIPNRLLLTTITALLLIATGHFGGLMTHGEGYLTRSFEAGNTLALRPADIQEAPLYAGIIEPILKEKCGNCHGSTKQKGGLRLDGAAFIQKGGKNGDVLDTNGPNGSELLHRCLLPMGHEDHMPPKEKPQLSSDELEILRWWLAAGANIQVKTKAVPQSVMVRKALQNWQNAAVAVESPPAELPLGQVAAISPQLFQELKQAGVLAIPIGQESNWLSISLVNLPKPSDTVFLLLEKAEPQVVWLNLSSCGVPEAAWISIGKMKQLRRLSLNHSSVNDAALRRLKNLQNLQFLNLAGTKVTSTGLRELADLRALNTVFLFKTGVQAAEWSTLQASFPDTKLDSGGYQLPLLETDTLRKKMEQSY